MSIATCLDLRPGEGLLAEARLRWPSWQEGHPVLSRVGFPRNPLDLKDVDQSLTDQRLLALAELAATDGADEQAAAALLCWVVLPGVAAWAGRFQYRRHRPDLDMLVAGHLWQLARTFPWRTGHKVAANLVHNVERQVRAEYRPAYLRQVPYGAPGDLPEPEARRESSVADSVRDLLDDALSAGAISVVEAELVELALAEVGAQAGLRRRDGLMSTGVTDALGARLGIAGRTVRTRLSKSLRAMRVMVGREAA